MWLRAASSWAATVAGVSPQGKVSVVESVKITFDSAVIAFGDAQAMAPAKVTCGDPGIKGSGRWLDPKRWTYVFHAKLGPGVHCAVDIDPAFRTLAGQPITGSTHFEFNTGGPHVRRIRPSSSSRIEDEQLFVVRFNGDVAPAALVGGAVERRAGKVGWSKGS